MTDSVANIAQLMGNLVVGDARTGQSNDGGFRVATAELRRHATDTVTRIDSLQNVINGPDHRAMTGHTQLFSFLRDCDELARVARQASQAVVDHIIDYITLLGKANNTQRKILAHFRGQVRDAVRTVLGNAGDGGALWMIVEECYDQSIRHDGALHSDAYYIPFDEAALEWPYDPDFESEEYYEHENRLDIDEGYAEAFRQNCERRVIDRSKRNDEWVVFWVKALRECPDGPTLFYPPATQAVLGPSGSCSPPKLIRTFDAYSSGVNNERVIASVMSRHTLAESRLDILQLRREEAKAQLHRHLTKSLCEGASSDNLISWTSSLLFALQYAIYRCRFTGLPKTQVHICVLNPAEFRQGQFMRDMALIEWYRDDAQDTANSFFRFRLGRTEYDNGEYLSQGRLRIEECSCTATLHQLKRSGLYELYPELGNLDGQREWTNRVRDIRQLWAEQQATTQKEIGIALRLARCLPRFGAVDVALMFLTLRNRKLHASATGGPNGFLHLAQNVPLSFPNSAKFQQELTEWDKHGPPEVRRYRVLLQRFASIKRLNFGLWTDEELLRQLFVCVGDE